MNFKTIKARFWRWTKIISIIFGVTCVIAYIFWEKVDPNNPYPKKVQNTAQLTKVPNGSLGNSGDALKTPIKTTNTESSGSTGINVPEASEKSLNEAKKKEIYRGYREIQNTPVEIMLAWMDMNKMTDYEKVSQAGQYVHDKEVALAKKYGIEWEDIDKIVWEAIQKWWNLEANPQR